MNYLVFDKDTALAEELRKKTGACVFLVECASAFARKDRYTWTIDICQQQHFVQLFSQLAEEENFPLAIIHALCSAQDHASGLTIDQQLEQGVYSLFHLSQQLLQHAKRSKAFKAAKKQLRLLYLHDTRGSSMVPAYSAVAAFCRSVTMEEPGFIYKSLGFLQTNRTSTDLADIILRELDVNKDSEVEVFYAPSGRKIKRIEELVTNEPGYDSAVPDQNKSPFYVKENGTYIITGGLGALGKLVARHLAAKAKVNLVLISRSSLSPDDQLFIADLEKTGSTLVHYCADVGEKDSLAQAILAIKQGFSQINGVIHSAGTARDTLLLKKSFGDFQAVIRPKVHGSVFLYEVTQNDGLDFFILFSSLSSVLGNIGQTDYAFANRFQDELAETLNHQSVSATTRYLAINWPLWEEGGMNIDEGQQQWLKESMGLVPLTTQAGLDSMAAALRMDASAILIAQGVGDKLRKHLLSRDATAQKAHGAVKLAAKKEPDIAIADSKLWDPLESYICKVVADELSLPLDRLNPVETLENFGIDSNAILRISRKFELEFGELSKTLFYEYQSVRELTGYFYENYAEKIARKFSVAETAYPPRTSPTPVPVEGIPTFTANGVAPETDAVAIIGLSGVYPGAEDLNQFWASLQAGRDSVSEIPVDRWDHSVYFDPDKDKKGKSYSKWGGFLTDIKGFDPLFFNIPPKEANHIDPQERLFLTTAWHTLEDAGYTRQGLGGQKVGVYVGVMWGQYQLLGADKGALARGLVPPPASFSSIANRVSFVMNFTGPSLAVDTMCSSSLTAIHLARRGILAGECDYALAGGVNLIVHPARYVQLCYEKFLSSDGRCRSFGAGGDGYVPGEGVGAVLLKRLSRAIADGDHIHGVLLSTAINHGGKTNGYRVPNPKAQAEVIRAALTEAKISADSLAYAEAHGTGTPLGDPIEMVGLKNGLGELLDSSTSARKIALGSVKSNVGHLESAAAIAGLSKILLQLRHKMLVPSLHAEELNSHIPFAKSPFKVQQTLEPWTRLVNRYGEEIPLRASLSSFGAGGSNGHLIVEEYIAHKVEEFNAPHNILVVSARTQAQLHTYARQLLHYTQRRLTERDNQAVQQHVLSTLIAAVSHITGINGADIRIDDPLEDLGFNRGLLEHLHNYLQQLSVENVSGGDLRLHDSIADIGKKWRGTASPGLQTSSVEFHQLCYTLQTGRETFAYRLAIVAEGFLDLVNHLNHYLAGEADSQSPAVISGRVDNNTLYSGDVGPQHLSLLPPARELARQWVMGAAIDWDSLYASLKPKRISAPLYPFSKKPYWFIEDIADKAEDSINMTGFAINQQHPLIDTINSVQSAKDTGIVFEKLLANALPLFSEHSLNNLIVFPASGYLEMALAAARSLSTVDYAINNIVLIKPLFYSGPQTLFMRISGHGDELQFEAYTLDGDIKTRHLAGKLCPTRISVDDQVDISPAQFTNAMSGEQFYNLLNAQKIGYDYYFRCITEVAGTAEGVIAKFRVADSVAAELHQYKVHPVIIDGAFQALATFAVDFGRARVLNSQDLKLPFEIAEIAYVNPIAASGYFQCKKITNDDSYQVVIADDAGRVCVCLSGIKLRPMPQFAAAKSPDTLISKSSSTIDAVVSYVATHTLVDDSAADLVDQFEAVEDFAALLILKSLQAIGLRPDQANHVDLDLLQSSAQVDNRYRKTLGAFLHVMERKGWIKTLAGDSIFAAASELTDLLGDLEQRYLYLTRQFPKVEAHLKLLWVCAEHYVDIIQGKKLATDIMFPAGSMSMLEAVYKGNQVADFFNSQARLSVEAFIADAVKHIAPGQKLRLLEVGAGTGGTSLGVMESLLPYEKTVSYIYTDISLGFVQFGRRQYASRFTFAEFTSLNIENDLSDQGFAQHSCDVIIAANVLHATRDIANTIQQVRRLLKPGGLLVLNEVTQFQNFTAATFGLLDGWWSFNDMASRIPHSPLLDEQQWQRVLEANGFNNVNVHQPFDVRVSQRVIIAQCAALTEGLASTANPARDSIPLAVTPGAAVARSTPQQINQAASVDEAAQIVDQAVKDILQIDPGEYDPAIAFSDYGVDSVLAVDIMQKINSRLQLELPTTSVFDHPTPKAMAEHIAGHYPEKLTLVHVGIQVAEVGENPESTLELLSTASNSEVQSARTSREQSPSSALDVAIIGMSGAFPGARNLAEFWQVLAEGRNTITEIPADRWDLADWFATDTNKDNRSVSRWGGFLEEMALFDPRFFNISPSEAEYIDPQQRQFLTHSWIALEDAGYSDRALDNANCGIYAGCKAGDYTVSLKEHGMLDSAYAFTGNAESILAARVAYFLNLKGPALSIDTSCSSSLVAIHQACEGLRSGEIDLAIAGGVAAISRPEFLVMASKAGMLSTDGRCWSFDARANGIVLSEGVGVIVLKPLHAAMSDGNRIHAVIKASGINQDGATNGITAPNGPSQTALIRKIYNRFAIDPASIQQVEAHGTGTPLGDPIEFNALTHIFAGTQGGRVLGSVKSNIGHGMASAGMAGLFKLILSVQHQKIVPTPGFEKANNNIHLATSPFRISDRLEDWTAEHGPRRGAVSSFGFSGTNAHIVLEEAPQTTAGRITAGPGNWLFCFTAKSKAALHQVCETVHSWLGNLESAPALADIAYTLLVGRTHHQFRVSVVAANAEELSEKLRELLLQPTETYNDIRNNRHNAQDVDSVNQLIEQIERSAGDDLRGQLEKLSRAFNRGVRAHWDTLYRGRGALVSLPAYPFAKERYWVGVKAKNSASDAPVVAQPSTQDSKNSEIYFYQPTWERADTPTALIWPAGQYLFITSDPRQLQALPLPEQQVSVILNHAEYARMDDHTWYINQTDESHFSRLIDELISENRFPHNIIHLPASSDEGILHLDKTLEYTVYSVRHLLLALCQKKSHSPINYILGYDHEKPDQRPLMQANSGFALSLQPIMPGLKMAVLGLPGLEPGMLSARLRTELGLLATESAVHEIQYIQNQRYILLNKPAQATFARVRFATGGVYLITGGAGGLGRIFARYLMREYRANVALLGRSAELAREVSAEFDSLPGRYLYLSADITDADQLQQAISRITNTFGPLTGVIHAAGVKNSKPLPEKTFAEFSATLSAKVSGAVLLDQLTRDFPLDFFVLFSSAASLLGDFGEADYAVANRFLDSFADWREAHRSHGQRQGITKAFNWPLWQGGGMSWKGGPSETLYLGITGFSYLDENSGVEAFVRGLNSELVHIFPATGNLAKLTKTILKQTAVTTASGETRFMTTDAGAADLKVEVDMNNLTNGQGSRVVRETPAAPVAESIKARLLASLTDIVARQFKLAVSDIHTRDNFGHLGADSISLKAVAISINKQFAIDIVPSVFFTCTDIDSLADFLLDEHPLAIQGFYEEANVIEVLQSRQDRPSPPANEDRSQDGGDINYHVDGSTGPAVAATTSDNKAPGTEAGDKIGEREFAGDGEQQSNRATDSRHETRYRTSGNALRSEPIAVIGMDGVFPGSPNLDVFWQHLAEEADLIAEVPPERWDWREFFGDPNTGKNKMRSKWGGFIADMNAFDSGFFGISPREADMMDPQHRLFLQVAWHAIENAGYDPSSLSGRKVGVFTGIQFNDYQSLLASDDIWNERVTTGCAHAMVANRVSYLLNLRGPSEAINTACSSGLIAVHRAIKSIQDGESEMAIAGGVSLILSPYNMLSAGVLDILAPDGRCKTFDKDANGYVKGEGVGALLLKPLRQAEADGDHIHCVIAGAAENHGGQATSLTAPNGSAQSDLIVTAVERAGIDVATIGYIEAHGTGTELGDPTEVDGLKRAFKILAREPLAIPVPYCGLGTVKTNIGHLEPAAGIAGLLKVILAIQHKTLPGNPHFKAINPYIKLDNSPFYVVERTRPWARINDATPLRAGVSSFGFGGANAHVVVEEYVESRPQWQSDAGLPNLFPFSAVNDDRLKIYVKNVLEFITESLQTDGRYEIDLLQLREELEAVVKEAAASMLGVPGAELSLDENFETLGLNAPNLGMLIERLNKKYSLAENEIMIFSQVSLASLCDQLIQDHASKLANYHGNCKKFVANPQATAADLDLARVAYTLQTGRKAYKSRLAFTANTIYELKDKLLRFVEGSDLSDIFTASAEPVSQGASRSGMEDVFDGDEVTQLIRSWVKSGKTSKLARLWTNGASINWSSFYLAGHTPRRIPLPVYPFARTRHWFKQSLQGTDAEFAVADSLHLQISAVEQSIVDIWKAHLGVEIVNIDSDFVALGGDSIISTKITSAIERQFDIKIPAGKFMKASTVREVAKLLEESLAAENRAIGRSQPAAATTAISRHAVATHQPTVGRLQALAPIVREDRTTNPLSSGQQRFWFLNKLHPDNPAFNIAAALRLEGPIAVEAMDQAYQWVVARHEVFRTVFDTKNGLTQQVVKLTGSNPLGFIDLAGKSSQEQAARVADFLNLPFKLETDSLLRVGIAQLTTDVWVLKIVVHHIISDVWSVGILFRELLTRYLEIKQGLPTSLPQLTVQFGDYSRWQQASLDRVIESELPYWKALLANSPDTIQLPFDYARQDVQTFESARISTKISAELLAQLKVSAQEQKVSLYVFLFAAFNLLLAKLTRQTDILVGSPVANRRVPETENMIGFLANTLVFRNDLSGDPSFAELISRVQQRVFDAFDHQSVPFSKVVEAVRPKRSGNSNPLFQVMFNMFPPMIPAESGEIKISPYTLAPDKSDYDLVLNVEERGHGIECQLDYNRNLFRSQTASLIAASWLAILEAVAGNVSARISQLSLANPLTGQVEPDSAQTKAMLPTVNAGINKVFITSTFVAEPIAQSLSYWIQRYALADTIEFAEYNQVFPQLLDPSQGLLNNANGYNLLLINFNDWVRFDKTGDSAMLASKVEKTLREFISALTNASVTARSPIVVLLCPPGRSLLDKATHAAFERLAQQELGKLANIYLITSQVLLSRYPVAEIYDHRADEQAHIPYSKDFFAALATTAARMFFSLKYEARKVIVLDCDNTLWKGIVGEEGLQGIEIDEPRRAWQEFLIRQQTEGKLLCLCSKNNTDDVLAVLDQREDMPLKRQHIVSWKINWNRKSDNIRELAAELNLGLESFIFIDDNQAEIEEVKNSLPEVLSLVFPQDPHAIDSFMKDTWVFDQLTVTAEDQARTQMYRENADRERFRNSAASYADFLVSLNLDIKIKPLTSETLPRVSQLTYRTNQFNFSSRRRSEQEIRELVENKHMECLTLEVSDRFGDYGLVGTLMFSQEKSRLIVDTFLMSCRVLGKGVEHRMMNQLGRIAQQRQIPEIAFYFSDSTKNAPAKHFIDSLPQCHGERLNTEVSGKAVVLYSLPSAVAAELTLAVQPIKSGELRTAPAERKSVDSYPLVRALEKDFQSPWSAKHFTGQTPTANHHSLVSAVETTGSSELEAIISAITKEELGITRLDRHDNFFDLGAHSSLLVNVAGKLEARLNREVAIVKLFQYPTLASLAEFLVSGSNPDGARKTIRDKGRWQRKKLLQLRQAQASVETATV